MFFGSDVSLTRGELHPDPLQLVSQNLSPILRLCPAVHVTYQRIRERSNMGKLMIQSLKWGVKEGGRWMW